MARPATPFRLPPAQHAELRAWLRPASVAPRLRVRLQCVQLRDQGQTVPQIAKQLAVSQATVRRALRRVRSGGLDALADRPRSGRPPRLTDRDLDTVEELLGQAAGRGQVWTMGQLAAWLARCRGVQISGGRLGRCCASAAAAGPRPSDRRIAAGHQRPDRPMLAGRAGSGPASRCPSSWLAAR